MTHPTNPDVIAAHNHVDDHVDNLATGPLTPPAQPATRPPSPTPLDPDAWTPKRREAWQTWFSNRLYQTGYAADSVDGGRTHYLTKLAQRSGIGYHTLLSWLQRGTQPTYEHARFLAAALGVKSVTVAYYAGLVGKSDLIALLHEAIPTVEDLHIMLECAATMPDGAYRRTLERGAQRMLALIETLASELGWTDRDFGPMAAEVAIRELANDPTPIDEHIGIADPDNPDDPDETPRQPVNPGPTARYQAAYDERGDAWSRTPG